MNEGVVSIGTSAFYQNYITAVTIPSSVNNIGNNAFGENEIRFVNSKPMVPYSDTNPFPTAAVYVPNGNGKAYRQKWDGLIIDPADKYVSINVRTPGSLYSRLLAQDLQLSDVCRLKLKGTLNEDDITILNKMNNLYDWDFSELNMTEFPDGLIGNKNLLVNIKLPNVLTGIEDNVFKGCDHLTGHILFPQNCAAIGDSAFYDTALDSITFSTSICIGKHAFQDCYRLKGIAFAENIEMGDSAFAFTTSLDSVKIKKGAKIGNAAFLGNWKHNLRKSVFEDGIISIGDNAFSSLESITFEGTIDSIGDISCYKEVHTPNISTWLKLPFADAGVMKDSPRLFIGGEEIENIVIPNEFKQIRPFAFYNCESLRTAQIPNSIKTIPEGMFTNCQNLIEVTLPTMVDSIKNEAFMNCPNLTNLDFPSRLTYIGESAFSECTSLTSLSFQSKVSYIGKNAFKGCENISEMKLSSSLNSIAEGAFNGCVSISELNLPNSISLIEDYAFANCSGLSKVIAHWKEPISIESNTFTGFTPDCFLYVPVMTSTKYSNVGWDVFPNLKEGGVLEVTGNIGGQIVYADETIRNNSKSFVFTPYKSFYLTMTPDEGYIIKKVKLNGENVTSQVEDGRLFIEEPEEDFTLSVVFADESIVDGDVNGDGIINVSDANCIISYILRDIPTLFYDYASDLNDDGIINVVDVYLLISKHLKNE